MEKTLSCTDTIQKIGHTIIDGVKVVQYVCSIPLNDPEKIRITSTKLDANMYKTHRDICRADFAEFEDSAYQLQEEYLNRV